MRKLMAVLLVAVGLTACTGGLVYDHYAHTPADGWERGDALTFDVDSLPADGVYDMQLGMRATSDYPFMSVTVIVDTKALPSQPESHDTVVCHLVDDRGNPMGHGVGNYQYEFPVSRRHYRRGDSLHIAVRHDMRRETIGGITDVGISLRHSR